jgi:hypothetical protein
LFFVAIAKKSNCQLHEMVFFDNQMNNINVGRKLGVHSIYTPEGVTHEIFEESIASFQKKSKKQ